MPIHHLQLGLDPGRLDLGSPGFAGFGLRDTGELYDALRANLAALRTRGVETDVLQVAPDRPDLDAVRSRLAGTPYDAVSIGGGVRLVPANSALFESLVGLVRAAAPRAHLIFPAAPHWTARELDRWFPHPGPATIPTTHSRRTP